MPAGPRIRANNVFGTTTDNPLAAAATSFNSVGLGFLPVVASAHAVVVLDPKRVFGDPEIVVVTAHTAAATVATITRAQYGTSARIHPVGTAWAHVPVDEDWREVLTSSTRPTNPYMGQDIFETDTLRQAYYTGAVWLPGSQVSIATSGARPATPFEGQFIFETDTNKLVGYGGVDWAPRDAGGQLGYAQAIVNQTGITTLVDLTNLSVAVTVGTGRRVHITGQVFAWQSSVANDRLIFHIREGGTSLNRTVWPTSPTANESNMASVMHAVLTPTAGTHTYKLSVEMLDGGTAIMVAGADAAAFILVEDIGAA